eukprot:TRINITY_DN16092_c0_g1_i1.p1 TRINITY_DN16092_c0_g1~~TRINITY_DN16092_c0_g1_i1.p1  ORF type:complete len:390 (-),score=78.03 TRINITY_DN16092_c0_g1_i1:72-1241(-)
MSHPPEYQNHNNALAQQIQTSQQDQPNSNTQVDVSIIFVGGNALKAGDMGISSDPFLVARLSGLFFKSKVVERTLNPVWDETWEIKCVPLHSRLSIEVWDKDVVAPNDFLGSVEYKVDRQDLAGEELTLDVVQPEGPPIGTIKFKIATRVSLMPQPYSISLYRFIQIHNSRAAGTATGTFQKESRLPSYCAYSLDMYHVQQVFGDKYQRFNNDYKAARMIFSKNPASRLVRHTVRTQHTALYREGIQRTETRQISSAEEWFKAFEFGFYGDQRREYTYVLLEEVLNFSETGAAFFTNFMSKHAMHSKAAKKVRYSGEFRILEHPDGSHRLVIDNASGTYAPDKNDLPLLKKVFEANFPGLDVEVYDYKDEKLEAYKKMNTPKLEYKRSI